MDVDPLIESAQAIGLARELLLDVRAGIDAWRLEWPSAVADGRVECEKFDQLATRRPPFEKESWTWPVITRVKMDHRALAEQCYAGGKLVYRYVVSKPYGEALDFLADARTVVQGISEYVGQVELRPKEIEMRAYLMMLGGAIPTPHYNCHDDFCNYLDEHKVIEALNSWLAYWYAAYEARPKSHATAVETPPTHDEVAGGTSKQTGPEGDRYMPPRWFMDKFGISVERLRSAMRTGRISTKDVSAAKSPPRYHYSVRDAMKLWPEDEIYLP